MFFNALALLLWMTLVFARSFDLLADSNTSGASAAYDAYDYPSSTITSKSSSCSSDMDIFSIYQDQTAALVQYTNQCNYSFVEICKQNNTQEMLVLSSIFSADNLHVPMPLSFLTTLPLSQAGSINYRVVIRFEEYPNVTTVYVSLDDKRFPLRLRHSKYVLEYMLPEQTYPNENGTAPQLYVSPKQVPYIKTSYLIVCFNTDQHKLSCYFVVTGVRVECYCPADQNGYVLVSIEMAAIWAALIILVIYFNVGKYGSREPEILVNLVLCLPSQVQYEYLVVFRVGLASDGFRYDNNYIDLLLLADNDEPIGQPLRYRCANLFGQMCAEMHMLVGKISPLPKLTGVRANHCDPHNVLHFQKFVVLNLRGEYGLLQEETIDQFITSEPKIFRPVPKDKSRSGRKSFSKKKSSKSAKNANSARQKVMRDKKHLDSVLPLFSSGSGLVSEKLATCMLVLGLTAYITMLARINLNSYEHWKNFGRSMIQFTITLFAMSAFSWLVILMLELFYTFCIGRHYLVECYLRVSCPKTPHTFQVIRFVYLMLLNISGIALLGLTITLSSQSKLDYASAFIWSGVNFSTVALTLGLWFLLDQWIIQSLKKSESQKDFLQLLNSDSLMTAASNARLTQANQSILFKFALGSTLSKGTQSFGPQLVNPNYLQKCNEPESAADLPKTDLPLKSRSKSKSKSKSKSVSKSSHSRRAQASSMLSSVPLLSAKKSKSKSKSQTKKLVSSSSSTKHSKLQKSLAKRATSSKLRNAKVSRSGQQISSSLVKRK